VRPYLRERRVYGDAQRRYVMTTGFHGGFMVSTGLMIASVVAALTLLREDGLGQSVNLIDLQAAGA